VAWFGTSEESPVHVVIPDHNIGGRDNSATQKDTEVNRLANFTD